MAKKYRYEEGTWFGIPLAHGGYGLGLVARATKKGPMILVYLFASRTTKPLGLEDVATLSAADAVKVVRTGDEYLRRGRWPIIGSLDTWNRRAWPFPDFVRKAEGLFVVLVKYNDKDPGDVISEESIDSVPPGLDEDSLYGVESVEFEANQLDKTTDARSADAEALSALRDVSVERAVHAFQHYLYFPNKRVSDTVAGVLLRAGFQVECRLGADAVNWLLLVSHQMIPEQGDVERVIEQLTEIADTAGGEYDGWEAATVNKSPNTH